MEVARHGEGLDAEPAGQEEIGCCSVLGDNCWAFGNPNSPIAAPPHDPEANHIFSKIAFLM
jgi:hypothetical protein